jgi:TonB family protein
MKRILLLTLAHVVFVGGAVCQEPESGIGPGRPIFPQRYSDQGDGFSVLLPSKPAMTTSKFSREDGKERTKRVFTVTVNDVSYSIEVFENFKPRQELEEFIAEGIASFKYDPASERKLTVNGFPGKEYSSQAATTSTVVQFLATEDRLFRFTATGPATAAPVIKDFFSSIKLGEDPDQIYTGRDVDVKARLLKRPEPPYTSDARKNRVEGTVILKVVMSKTGRVENIKVIVGLPHGLTEQAIKAARQITFVPAMKYGKPVSMWMQLEYNFSL